MHDNEHLDQVEVRRRATTAAPAGAESAESADLELPRQIGNRAFGEHVAIPAAVQRSAERTQGAGPLDPEIESDIRAAQGGGAPLDERTRSDMGAHLGVDLSAVRVHADGHGDALSRSVQAEAFTVGSDVFFRSGRYAPETGEGRQLLAHELTHVVQQTAGTVPDESRVSHPDDPHERQADAVADAVTATPAPATASGAGSGVQRQASEEEAEDPEAAAAPAAPAVDEGLEEEEQVGGM